MQTKSRLITIGIMIVMAVGLLVPAASAVSVRKSKTVPHCPDWVWICYVVNYRKAPPLEPWIR